MMELDVNCLRKVYPGTKGWSGRVFKKVSSCLLNETTVALLLLYYRKKTNYQEGLTLIQKVDDFH